MIAELLEWRRRRRVEKLKVRLASQEAELELLNRTHRPGKPHVVSDDQFVRMRMLAASIAGIKEELHLRSCNS